MELIDEKNAAEYLRRAGRVAADESVVVRALGGGVSNVVLYVERAPSAGQSFVLKQGRERLRVRQPWFCSVDRVLRELEVLRVCERISLDGAGGDVSIQTPGVLFVDRDNYLFAMTAAPADHAVWKAELLAGTADARVAAALGCWLARLHGSTWRDERLANELGDLRWFDALRLDPYYRAVAGMHADLRPQMEKLIAAATEPRCVVHADFSPKNVLVYPAANAGRAAMLVDFETGHFGNPAFDLGFFLTHLVLKAFYHAPRSEPFVALIRSFLSAYAAELQNHISAAGLATVLEQSTPQLAGCLLARLDGKSPVEYFADERRRDQVRKLARRLLANQNEWIAVLAETMA
jgi:aminoglycoside phosphotransferase (APT) family kinase protein